MARYTAEKELTFNTNRDSRIVNVNGSVALAAWDGVQFIDDANSPLTTGPYELFTKGARIRLTPDGGSSFWIEEGEQQ